MRGSGGTQVLKLNARVTATSRRLAETSGNKWRAAANVHQPNIHVRSSLSLLLESCWERKIAFGITSYAAKGFKEKYNKSLVSPHLRGKY